MASNEDPNNNNMNHNATEAPEPVPEPVQVPVQQQQPVVASNAAPSPAISRKRPIESMATDAVRVVVSAERAAQMPLVAAAASAKQQTKHIQQQQQYASAAIAAARGGPHYAGGSAIEIVHNKPASASANNNANKKVDKSDKGYKGLRQFSMLVCRKVEEKGTTSYNEVADELVAQVMEEKGKAFDEKNIRRRVYDALNVLMAMDIITKDKKAITWKGLPTTASQDLEMLGRERDFRAAEVAKKKQALQDLLIQQVCFRNLTAKNEQSGDVEPSQKIPLPFIIVNTHSSAVIQCNMSKDLTDVMFDFSMPFEINDDNTILKRLGMHKTDMATLREMMPADILKYCQENGLLDAMLVSNNPVVAVEEQQQQQQGNNTEASGASADSKSGQLKTEK